jgi:hypothetical protein
LGHASALLHQVAAVSTEQRRFTRFRPGEEVTDVNTAMTIESFNAFLKSEQGDNYLQKTLRQLAALQKPDDVRALATEPEYVWLGWNAPPSG